MGIYRGAGGTGDAVNDASSEATLVQSLVSGATTQANNAAASATAAQAAETQAVISQGLAADSATAAATSATNAANSASTATTQATNAATSATAAQTAEIAAELAETNAETAETNAETAASQAATSATNASNSASAASTSATNASNSASAASTSATNASNSASAASTSASNASTSATAAASSASAASTSASNASTSATNAANSATSASTSATTATTQAGIATTQATNAASSASAASTSATNASNSASTATTQATNASNSASAAATSATNAAASFDSFDDRYLGAKSSAPSVDNDGNALLTGALYFDTTSSAMKVWNGTTWLDAYASLSGALIATNNLSDLNNVATARTNLGVAIGTNVQAYDADLAAIAALTPTADNFIVGNGTTWILETPAQSRTSLGLGTIATLTAPSGTVVGTSDAQTLTNKTIALGSNTVSGTLAQFNTAVTDADLVSIAGTETLTNKTLTSPVVTGGSINNTPIGASTASTGAFSTLSATGVTTVQAGSVSAPAITTTGDTNTGIFFPAADTIAFTEGGTEAMRIDSSANVGIGTASPRFVSGYRTLTLDNTTGSTLDWNVNGTRTFSIFAYSGNIGLQGTNSADISISTNNTERMRIDSSGLVGIGTSSPSSFFDGARNLVVGSGSGAQGMTIYAGTANSSNIFFADGTSAPAQYIGQIRYFHDNNYMMFVTNDGERMRIDSSGNVGIGTSSPTALLHVNGTARATSMSLNGVSIGDYNLYSGMVTRVSNGGGIGINSANSTDNAYIYFGSGTSSGAQQSAAIGRIGGDVLALFTASAERMRIDSSGNVGIGKTNPSQKLDISGNLQVQGTNSFVYVDAGGASGSALKLEVTGTTSVAVGADSNHPLLFKTNATERGRFDTSGNFLFNSGYGSVATAYGCRAWVNFNGTGTVAIRASGNVSSITDNGTGDYTVNFTTAFPDANYAFAGIGKEGTGTGRVVYSRLADTLTTSACQIRTRDGTLATNSDTTYVLLSFFR
jgi:hypothetical protein